MIPRGGGLPIYLGLVFTSLIFLPMNKILLGILLSSFLIVLLGLWDDYADISAQFRFFANLLISALVISFGLGIPFISNPLGGCAKIRYLEIHFDFLALILSW